MNRTWALVATGLSAAICWCMALMSCIFGAMGITGTPFNTTVNGLDTGSQAMPMPLAVTLLCVSVILLLIPVAVGFFTLRKKAAPAAVVTEPMPPAS